MASEIRDDFRSARDNGVRENASAAAFAVGSPGVHGPVVDRPVFYAAQGGSIEIASRADFAHYPRWTNSFAAFRKDHRYYELIDDTMRQGLDYRYFILKNESNGVCAIQPFFMVSLPGHHDTKLYVAPAQAAATTRINPGMTRIANERPPLLPARIILLTVFVESPARTGMIASAASIFSDATSEATEIAAECVSTIPARAAATTIPRSPNHC
jgi:hypothetical protein